MISGSSGKFCFIKKLNYFEICSINKGVAGRNLMHVRLYESFNVSNGSFSIHVDKLKETAHKTYIPTFPIAKNRVASSH